MDERAAEKEKHLYGLKWHDYRMLKPDTATLVFLNEFAKALTDFNELTGKSRYFSFLKSITKFDPEWIKKHRPQFWGTIEKLRHKADSGCFDYADFWKWAFEALNELGFQVTYLNAFLNIKLRLKIKERKAEHEESFIKRSESPYFRAENYVGSELQDDYYSYLVMATKHLNPTFRAETLHAFVGSGEISPVYLEQHSINYSIEGETV